MPTNSPRDRAIVRPSKTKTLQTSIWRRRPRIADALFAQPATLDRRLASRIGYMFTGTVAGPWRSLRQGPGLT